MYKDTWKNQYPMLLSCMFYRKIRFLMCSVHCQLHFTSLVIKISADCFKDEITPLIKKKNGLKISQDLALNHIRDKVTPWYKISYKVLKEEYEYDPLLEIYPFTTLIQLKDFIGRVHHCVTVIDKWISDSNFTFVFPLSKENLGYYFKMIMKQTNECLQSNIAMNLFFKKKW